MFKKYIVFTTLMLLSSYSFADIKITNNSNAYLSAKTQGMCGGSIKPHETDFYIPQATIDSLCYFSNCSIEVFAAENCQGSKIAIVTVDRKKGVVDINNTDKGHYVLSGSGKNLNIDEVHHSKSSFFDLFGWS